MSKYFTIVIRADDEKAARALTPGEKIGPNTIIACSLGDALTLNDKLKELIPSSKEDEVAAIGAPRTLRFSSLNEPKLSHELRMNKMTPNNIGKPDAQAEAGAARCAVADGSARAPLKQSQPHLDELVEAAKNLREIVEGPRSEQWSARGFRMKDTCEWVALLVALENFKILPPNQ